MTSVVTSGAWCRHHALTRRRFALRNSCLESHWYRSGLADDDYELTPSCNSTTDGRGYLRVRDLARTVAYHALELDRIAVLDDPFEPGLIEPGTEGRPLPPPPVPQL